MAEPAAHTEVAGVPKQHAEPTAFGSSTRRWSSRWRCSWSSLILIWKKVPAAIGKALDTKIAVIRDQLDEAEALRKEAEALKAEYEAKAKAADAEAAAMLERAQAEAEAIVAKADDRRRSAGRAPQAMAEDKIAAEERAAIDELRATAAKAATAAAAKLIAERNDAASDAKLVDQAIAGLSR